METTIKAIPWPVEIPILPGTIEELLEVPPPNGLTPKVYQRFRLEQVDTSRTSFQPELVQLDRLSPESTRERLRSIGLVPAPLREYLSLERHIKDTKMPLDRVLVYVGEFVKEFEDHDWMTTFAFYSKRGKYIGYMPGNRSSYFSTPERMEHGYQQDHYAVAVQAQ